MIAGRRRTDEQATPLSDREAQEIAGATRDIVPYLWAWLLLRDLKLRLRTLQWSRGTPGDPLHLPRTQGRALEAPSSARTPTTSRSAVAGPSSTSLPAASPLHVTWVVLAAAGVREREAVSSAAAFLKDVEQTTVVLKGLSGTGFPLAGAEVKEVFEDLKRTVAPDLVIVPRRDDAHQDHRLVAELTWNTFRDHLVLEMTVSTRSSCSGRSIANRNRGTPAPNSIKSSSANWVDHHATAVDHRPVCRPQIAQQKWSPCWMTSA